jgi:hypothetical protein
VFAFADAEASGEEMPVELGPFKVSEPASLIACRFHLGARGVRGFYLVTDA